MDCGNSPGENITETIRPGEPGEPAEPGEPGEPGDPNTKKKLTYGTDF